MIAILLVSAATIVALAVCVWAFAQRRNDPSVIDGCWGLGFVVIAWISFGLADVHPGRTTLLTALTTAWGVRLGLYLFARWKRQGPDARYVHMLRGKTKPARYMLTNIFGTQVALMLVVALPLQLGAAYAADEGSRVVHAVGLALALAGLAFEWTADWQLSRFKASPHEQGAVMDRGVWRYSRHPNYFGEFCVWWGLFLISTAGAATYAGVVSPIVMTVLLLRVSGVTLLESHLTSSKPAYADYAARTSAFVPLPPRAD